MNAFARSACILAALILATVGTGAQSKSDADKGKDKQGTTVSGAAKAAGTATKDAAKTAAKGTADGAKAVGSATVKGTEAAAKTGTDAAKATGSATEKGAKATASGAKKLGSGIAGAVTPDKKEDKK
jgi:hypothetical protein